MTKNKIEVVQKDGSVTTGDLYKFDNDKLYVNNAQISGNTIVYATICIQSTDIVHYRCKNKEGAADIENTNHSTKHQKKRQLSILDYVAKTIMPAKLA